jgi:ribosomal-protein-alanine N-acetyltransferase
LRLRRLRPEDGAAYYKLRSSPEIMRYLQRPLVPSIEEATAQIVGQMEDEAAGKMIVWAIADLDDKFIGIAGYWRMQLEHQRAEIGYMLDLSYHGRGLATEAVAALVNYGFTVMKLHKIEADIDPDNLASARLLERLGFQKEAYFRENRLFNDRYYNSCWLGLLRREWERNITADSPV